jgi:AcrR family transcriptional regulator
MPVPRKSAAATRERLLRAAECCFTEHGYEGSSLRQITRLAHVNLAAVNYHFSSKRELWIEMMQRRLAPLNTERLRMLEAARAATPPGQPLSLEQLCEAVILPIAKAFNRNRSSCLTAARMVGRAINVPPSLSKELNRRNLDQFWGVFRAALREAMPELTPAEVDWKYYFLMSSMLGALAWQGRQAGMERQMKSENLEPMLRRLAVFIAAGLRQPLPPEGRAKPKAKR